MESDTPCAVAHGVIEVSPREEAGHATQDRLFLSARQWISSR